MSITTQNLEMFKYDSVADKNRYFNLNDSMNNNWDKIDAFAGTMSAHASAINNPHSVTKMQVGLGNCDNTSDANKPISIATQSALDLKANAADVLTALMLKSDKTTLHALKCYLDEGEILTDAEGLTAVKKMAHSTFDRSKFTVEGSTIVTEDGIASGFTSYSTYISGNNISIPANSKIEIILKLVDVIALASTEPQRSVFSIRNADNTLLDVRFSPVGGSFAMVYANSATTRGTEGTGGLDLTGTYFMKFVFDNGTLKAYRGNTLDTLSQLGNTVTDVYMNLAIDTLYICTSTDHATFPFKGGSIDLKYFQIIVNDVPYFSGNKTGIDTIKPDNFEAPSGGSLPTISADGIASGFSSTSYLTAPNVVIDTTKPFKCCLELTTGTVSGQGVVSFDSNWYVSFTSTKYFSWRPTSNQSNWMQTNETFEDNTKYYIEFGYDGTDIFINYKKQGGNLVTKSLTPANYVGATNLNISSIGCLSTLVFNGSIDLNAFKIYVDGNLVYQPCLKIPYTESKTGSKIVDAVYRDRVNDMAIQFGYANYYTLDEDNGNFTLPQVELYGYIEKRARDMAHPVGMPFFRLTDEINEDEVRLEGAEVDKGLYLAIEQKLADYCTASADPAKIILPNFIGKVPWGANDYGYISAGLPNITGYFVASDDTYSHIGGAFAIDSVGGAGTGGPGNEPIVSFNASRSSSIYSDSVSTVQPPAFKVRWLARWK